MRFESQIREEEKVSGISAENKNYSVKGKKKKEDNKQLSIKKNGMACV